MDRAALFDALLELTRTLSGDRSLAKALQAVSDTALELLPGDHASVRVLDHTRTELLCSARSGRGTETQPVSFEADQGVIGWVVEQGQLARIPDVGEDERFVSKGDQGFEIRSILAVPLWSAGEVVGVLAVTAPEPDAYDDDQEALALLLANCSVPPIEKARLARLAVTDPQTLTFNDTYLARGLRLEMERAKQEDSPLSVLVMNLDLFRRVNDDHGRGVGDEVLHRFAALVRRATRDDDAVVRRRGDEFVLVMPATSIEQATRVAERIRSKLGDAQLDAGMGRRIAQTASIGVATWNGYETADSIERRARGAMRTAKLHGRNRVHVDDGKS
ncbi:MAG: GGDEF domain-containing protein [Deltaproteobacteria bacterium]|jgi:diguanylate cyclase (GGDEF)-like protein|nr:GGDEF domain-containing protein [Deltaproteobacteria bacterium]MBW2530513.1 GGDEF domain-containing protein [Deltaproteobacteria bacterium]